MTISWKDVLSPMEFFEQKLLHIHCIFTQPSWRHTRPSDLFREWPYQDQWREVLTENNTIILCVFTRRRTYGALGFRDVLMNPEKLTPWLYKPIPTATSHIKALNIGPYWHDGLVHKRFLHCVSRSSSLQFWLTAVSQAINRQIVKWIRWMACH